MNLPHFLWWQRTNQKDNCRTATLKRDYLIRIHKNLGRVTELTFQVTLKMINEGKTMGFSIGPSPLELGQIMALQYMTIVHGCAYACAPHCCPIKMNSLPDDGMGI